MATALRAAVTPIEIPSEPLPPSAHDREATPIVSIIVPTFNERENVGPLVAAIHGALNAIPHEIVFVDDDSPDGTSNAVLSLARTDPSVRLIRRLRRRGLAGAVAEGILSTSTPYLAVIDADFQHDERLLPEMIGLLASGEAEIVVGSRYGSGGSVGDWQARRSNLSKVATRLARLARIQSCSDPMSGFFALTRPAFETTMRKVSPRGFKILLDILASSPRPPLLREVHYEFRNRRAGESKLDALVAWDYLMLLADKSVGGLLPVRFLSFAVIGGLGVVVHMATLAVLYRGLSLTFPIAQTVATVIAMTSNFWLNNLLTYRDLRLKGATAVIRGFLSFAAVCAVGAAANVGAASFLMASASCPWWLAGLTGILIGAVWNYGMSSHLTWRSH